MNLLKKETKNRIIAGIDEAGRGPLAGPVVAAAVVLPDDFKNSEITDSKKLSAKKREELAKVIKEQALEWSIVAVGSKRIEKLNIRAASLLAMKLAAKRTSANYLLIDGNAEIDSELPQEAVVKGDLIHPVISAASILAKVYRDHLMKILGAKYPEYLLEKHAGYPTKAHREAIENFGPSKIHRRTFKGVKEFL